ncbi:MAG TPA: hypothetical protein VFU43_05445 [Streptosporangiaceae bacterium]|nr:hypothetical protein [Streptosporangiaceae bacterium]
MSPSDPPRGRRHRFDPAALFTGLLFLSTAGAFAGAALAGREIPIVVAAPILLVGFAVAGFVRVATRSRR